MTKKSLKLTEKLLDCYGKLGVTSKKTDKISDDIWDQMNKIEKLAEKALLAGRKLPKSVSLKVGNYKISATLHVGYVNIKKIK